jgi:hypothetical protein
MPYPTNSRPARMWMSGVLLLLALLPFGLQPDAAAEDEVAGAVAFSHKTHAPLKIPCGRCHAGATTGDRAGFPALDACRVCHTAMTTEQARFPVSRVFRLPDFVYFSHQIHAGAKADCGRCHGNVNAMAKVTPEVTMNMKFCVDCHTETKAPAECYVCHELGQ